MNTTTTCMMKSQSLYHSFLIPNTKTIVSTTNTMTKLSSFNFPCYSSALFYYYNNNNNNNNNNTNACCNSAKNEYWMIKSQSQSQSQHKEDEIKVVEAKELKRVILGAASIGLVLFLMGQEKAWALGPEGPLVEEFWENVRRYALYALTVSTGVLYSVFQPIFELLKNPISAFLILLIIGGSFFIVSQILSAMVGVSEFSYDYAY